MLSSGLNTLDSAATTVIGKFTAINRESSLRQLLTQRDKSVFSPGDLRSISESLSTSFLSESLIANAALIREDGLIAERERVFTSERFYTWYPNFFRCEGKTFNEWVEWIGRENHSWLSVADYSSLDYSSYRGIAYCVHQRTPAATLYAFAVLNLDMLLPLLAEQEVLQWGTCLIRNGNQILYASGDNSEVHMIRVRSARTDFAIEIGLPEQYLNHKTLPMQRLVLYYTSILIAAALLLSLFFSLRSAAPMSRLLHAVSGTASPPSVPHPAARHLSLNRDYETVASGIEHLRERVEDSAALIEEQREHLRDQIFEISLQRALYSDDEKARFDHLFPDFPPRCQLALIVSDTKSANVENALAEASALRQALIAHFGKTCYHLHAMHSSLCAVLTPDADERIPSLAARVEELTDTRIRVCLSDFFESPRELNRAWQQAQNLNLYPTDASLVSWQSIPHSGMDWVDLPVTLQDLSQMYDALLAGNENLALAILSACADKALSHPDQLIQIRHASSMITNMLAQLKLEHPSALFSVIIPSFDAARAESLFCQELPACFSAVSRALLEAAQPENDLEYKVIRFINENLFQQDLCISYVTDHFGIAKATLQRIVKDSTGMTFSVYVADQRLARAWQLMQQPDASVQKVAEMCGYSTPSAFYKAFRHMYGIAPTAVSGERSPDAS